MATYRGAPKQPTPQDESMALAAIEKQRAGQKPTARESAALHRVQSYHTEKGKRDAYASVPLAHYVELSGRSKQVLYQQAERWGLPIGQAVIDLGAVLRKFHDLLADHGAAIKRQERSGPDTLDHWKTQNEKAKATRNQIRADLESRQVVPLGEMEARIDDLCRAFADLVTRAPSELAAKVAGLGLDKSRQAIEEWARATLDAAFGPPGEPNE